MSRKPRSRARGAKYQTVVAIAIRKKRKPLDTTTNYEERLIRHWGTQASKDKEPVMQIEGFMSAKLFLACQLLVAAAALVGAHGKSAVHYEP